MMYKKMLTYFLTPACILAFAIGFAAHAEDLNKPILLLSKSSDPAFDHDVIIMVPIDGGAHAGFFLTRPSPLTLDQAFPDDPPSVKAKSPISLGGPKDITTIFALTEKKNVPDTTVTIPFGDDLVLVIDSKDVDKLIADHPNETRFFAGNVVWPAGILEAQVNDGNWLALPVDKNSVMRQDTTTLWQGLMNKKVEKNTASEETSIEQSQ
jgi:putative AlgH/UPF0301 family transcriptional regulator